MTDKLATTTGAGEGRGTSWVRRHRNLVTGLLLMVAAWLLFLPAVRYGFVYFDDVRILRDHPELYGQASLAENLRAIFVTGFPREEPLLLRDVSWVVDGQLFGFGNPLGYHLNNVLLHGGVVALLFTFLLQTTRRYGFALAVAGAYLISAIHVEPVAWIMGRKDILSTLFMLAALLAQTRRLEAGGNRARCGWYVVTLACALAGLLSKISVLTFPAVLFLHAVFLPYLNGTRAPGARFDWGKALWREVGLMLPALVASVLIYRWYGQQLTAMGIFDRGYTARGAEHLWNLLMVNPLGFWIYVKQTFLPVGLNLLHPWPTQLPAYPAWQIAVSLATVVALGGAEVWLFRRRKDLCFFFTAFFVLMIPYLNLIYIGIWVAERYLYFAGFCLLALAVGVGEILLRSSRPGLRLGVGVAAAGFAAVNLFQVFSYQPAWRNAETLWQHHLTLPDAPPAAYANLASYYYAESAARAGTAEGKVSLQKMAVVVDAALAQFWPDRKQTPPRSIYFIFFLQSIGQQVNGDLEAAVASLLMADQLNPGFDSTQLNLARLYHELAGKTMEPAKRQQYPGAEHQRFAAYQYARAAQERFAAYLALAYRARPVPPELRREQAEIAARAAAATQTP